jgi:hypothetical protein
VSFPLWRVDILLVYPKIPSSRRIEFPEITVINFHHLTALLRVTTKYRMARCREEVLARLRLEWPATLPAHDVKVAAFGAGYHQQTNDVLAHAAMPGQMAAPAEDLIVNPADVIALLRRCDYDEPDLLVPLFYDLSKRSWQFGGGHFIAPLSHADIERLIIGSNALHRAQFDFLNVPLHLIAHELRRTTCRSGVTHVWQQVSSTLTKQRSQTVLCSPVEDWGRLSIPRETAAQLGCCPDCAGKLAGYVEEQRLALWQSLQALFQL